MTAIASDRERLALDAAARRNQVIDLTLKLVAAASPNPPGDTRLVADTAASILRDLIPGVEITPHPGSETVANLVARVRGAAPGRRLVFNGHLDTYPLGDPAGWTFRPTGEATGDRVYGRGASDMKGGIAASIVALAVLARHRDLWNGEAVLAL